MPTPTAAKTTAFERLLRSTRYKESKPEQKLGMMLAHKDFKWLLENGYVLDVQHFAGKIGFTPQYVRVLCREGKIDCIKRGYGASSPQADEEFQYFFLPDQYAAFFAAQKGKA